MMQLRRIALWLGCLAGLWLVQTPEGLAQKKIRAGTITYEIVPDENVPGMEMFQDSEVRLTFQGNQVRMDMRMLGGMIQMITLSQADKPEDVRLFFNMMGQKFEVTPESEDEEASDISILPQAEGEVQWTKEKKKVAGYKCRKAVIKTPDGGLLEYWVARKVRPPVNPMAANLPEMKGKGMPLEFTADQQGVRITFRAVSVSGEVDPDAFKAPEGYKKVTEEELKELLGQ